MKTAAISETPLIQVLASYPATAKLLVDALVKPGIEVAITDVNHLNLVDSYKFVWLVDPEQSTNHDTTQALATANKPTLVVFPTTSPVLTELSDGDSLWPDHHLSERRLLAFLMEQLPTAMFVLVPNLVLPASVPPLTTDLNWLIQSLKTGVLLDPNLELGFAIWDEVGLVISQLVSRPHVPQTILLSPPQVQSHLVLKELQVAAMKQNGEQPDILVHPVRFDVTYPPAGQTRSLQTPARQILYQVLNQIELPSAITKPSIPQPSVVRLEQVGPTTTTPSPTPFNSEASPIFPAAPNSISIPTQLHGPDFSLSQSLANIFTHTNAVQKTDYLTKITKTEVVEGKRSSRRKRLFIFGALSVGIATATLVFFGVFSLNLSLVKQNLLTQLSDPGLAPSSVSRWRPILSQLLDIQAKSYGLIISNPKLDEAQAVIKSDQLWRQAQTETQTTQDMGQKLIGAVLGANDSEIEPTAQNVLLHGRSAHEFWSELQASAGQIDLSASQTSVDSGQFQTAMDERLKTFNQMEKLIPVITKLAGTDRLSLAVFLQNSQELRPTGGFLQAVGLLNFNHGHLVAHSAYSSYAVDGKIVGQVAAPDDIRAVLGETNFYFRDSNWDANFPTSMQKSGWFLDKALGKPIDGAIAINTSALPTLLAAIGPVELPSYNEVITAANVDERLEFHSEIQLTPGGTDYTTTLLSAILTNIQSLNPDKYPALITALSQMLEEQGALIAFSDKDIQQSINELGWSGAILTPPCPTQFAGPGCQVDTIAQVEANVGVNKANLYLDRDLTHHITLARTAASHERTIHYTNTAKSIAWPRGPYKAYVRLYLPENATNIEVVFNQTKLAAPNLKTYSEYTRQVVAFGLEVPVGTSRDLIVRYTTPLKTPTGEKLSYILFDQKQPGTEPMPVKTTIELSADLSPTLIAPQAEVIDKKVIFHATTKTHLLYGVSAN